MSKKNFPKFTFRVLNRGTTFGESVIAIYRKNAIRGEAPLWIGKRKDSKKFLHANRRGDHANS